MSFIDPNPIKIAEMQLNNNNSFDSFEFGFIGAILRLNCLWILGLGFFFCCWFAAHHNYSLEV